MSGREELHLFVFEGAVAEPMYVKSLEKHFMGETFSIKCVYDTDIYQLYRRMKDDDFETDIVTILKERNDENIELLKGYGKDDFAFVYLFFDYDAHATMADDVKIVEMLSFFDNETEHGMLYLSYPMVEAIRHYRDMESFRTLTAKCKRGKDVNSMKCPYKKECDEIDLCLVAPHYKNVVHSGSLQSLANINKYDINIWRELIKAHIFKMNYLVNDSFSMPKRNVYQIEVFTKQLEKHIRRKCPSVAVLSAFPMYALDYYGVDGLSRKLGREAFV